MKNNIVLSTLIFTLILSINLYPQQCEVFTSNIVFESSNSLTFDVYVKNTGVSNWVYSHGSFAWTYQPAFLNGGMPTFSLVEGFSDFPAGAYPPSALITNPNILRTSSSMPGSNGTILPGQSLRLYRFRLQTSASSFSSTNFSVNWKEDITPKTRIYEWDNFSGLPEEVIAVVFSTNQMISMTNSGSYNQDFNSLISTGSAEWVDDSTIPNWYAQRTGTGTTIAANNGTGTAGALYSYGSDSNTDRSLGSLGSGGAAAGHFAWGVLLRNTSGGTITDIRISYTGEQWRNSAAAAQTVTFWYQISSSVITSLTPNVNDNWISINALDFTSPITGGSAGALDGNNPSNRVTFSNISIPGLTLLDNEYIMLRWSDVDHAGSDHGLSIDDVTIAWTTASSDPSISVIPSTLSNFIYALGSGPSISQSYILSGSNLTPASGSITVTGSDNYEVSDDNVSFSANLNIPYSDSEISATVYVRLKAGLPLGLYNSEIITNAGGGATTVNVTCNGSVIKPEPTNQVTNFTAVNGNPPYYYINLSWNDASGGTEPDGYLVKRSSISFANITDPVDGIAESNSIYRVNVAQGIEALTFGLLYSDSTYYFKIFPYTNSGTQINYKTDGVPQFSLATTQAPSLPVTENFNYTTSSNLADNGWVAHSGVGINPIQVSENPLTYSGYSASGVGKSVSLTTSGEDVNRAFNSVTSGTVYASFMVNITSAQTAGDYFFNLGPENTSSLFYGRVFVKKAANDNLAFGLSKSSTTSPVVPIYTDSIYTEGNTYLIVVAYEFNPGENDDVVKLWVNPVLNETEPLPDVIHSQAVSDATSLGMFALRQGSASNAAALILGGIRVSNTWLPGSGGSTFQLTVGVDNGWNMVSIPGLHPVDQGVDTWWAGRDGTANVFGYVGGYNPVTEVAPGKGYWMKHLGEETYNTGDEWPTEGITFVPHNPIPANAGWNLVGGYEEEVLISAITTDPGVISATIYGYASGGYTEPTLMVPGKAYWIKVSAEGDIIIPSGESNKGTTKIAGKNEKQDWGRIVITDNAGRSYTLYAAKEGASLSKYELPPLPPAGMFDVRFNSGRFVENISSSSQMIDMSGVEYPVKVRAENIAITIQDVTGKIVDARLKAGEEVTISNSTIQKLIVMENIIPDVYSLEQNYPNPFNPSTVIEFSIPEDASNVSLIVYDALGQKVAELINGGMEAGKYSFNWNASNLASGLYIYELRATPTGGQANKFVSIKKMLLLK